MKQENAFVGRPALVAAAAIVFILAGGAVQAMPIVSEALARSVAPPAAAAKTVLEYKMPAGSSLTYQNKTEQAQVMEVQGQSIDTQTTNTSTVTFKSKGLKDKDFLLGVTIDDITATVTSSVQGEMSPDMGSVKGKSFDMVLSALGTEVDVSGAEAITYSVAAETRNLASGFKMFFPDLPGKPIKVGESWPSKSGTDESTSSMSIRIDFQNVNILEGFETVDGMKCARISTDVTGTLTGSGNQQGMDLTFSGTIKGKNVWYFAVKEGIYVKATSESTTQMSIDVAAAGMTIPMTQTSNGEVKLTSR